MNYALNSKDDKEKPSFFGAARSMLGLVSNEKGSLALSFFAALLNAGFNLTGPLVTGYAIDNFIKTGNFRGVLWCALILFVVYIAAFATNYLQIRVIGSVSQRMLWRLRGSVFAKLQSLPLSFFNQNKVGDLISRINNDTEKINMFFSQALGRFVANFFIVVGAGVFILSINWRLALVSLIPAAVIVIVTRILAPWVKGKNVKHLSASGALSAEIQEAISNFRVILAFNRRDYFKTRFDEANKANFKASMTAGMVNGFFTPFYDLAANIAQLIVLGYGIHLIVSGHFAIGLLVSFVLYINRFYDPLREVAQLFTSLQSALAGWERIEAILKLESDLQIVPDTSHKHSHKAPVIEFSNVSFGYPDGAQVLKHIDIKLEHGKTYALVGPTGGGKTTTASLIARLYDPSAGKVLLDGKDIRSYDHAERAKKIGFILQEPFLFTGTVRDNVIYGNTAYANAANSELEHALQDLGLEKLLARFDKGLDTPVGAGGGLSLGQKQLIAFIRAVLRKPEILILDEATANVDTVTEGLLEEILRGLPKETTRVIIAHRLNTIENADEIFFVNGGTVTQAGSMEHAVEMLLHGKRKS